MAMVYASAADTDIVFGEIRIKPLLFTTIVVNAIRAMLNRVNSR